MPLQMHEHPWRTEMCALQDHTVSSLYLFRTFCFLSDFELRVSDCLSDHFQQYRHPLDSPKRAQRSNHVTRQGLYPARPAHLQHAERMLQCQNEGDETELPEFDANIEADQCQRELMPRQAGA